jgi:quercetin dioxygenase-like cupin family protein
MLTNDAGINRNIEVSTFMRFVTGQLHLLLAMPPRFWAAFFVLVLAGCASGPPKMPYPAFLQTDELENAYLASVPGTIAKQFSGDPQTRRTTNRIDLPAGWEGTSGGTPGMLLEIVVLKGELTVGDVRLGPGGYAHIPPGTFGFNMTTGDGAQILYYRDIVDPLAMIQTPVILDARLIDWKPTDHEGVTVKELRADPGNGARTWLMRISPGASIPWQSSSVIREGYLASGQYQHSECVVGEIRTWTYFPGGYFLRPAGAVNGGPEAKAITESVWVLRERSDGAERMAEACVATSPAS